MANSMPTGTFTCEFTTRRGGGTAFVREEKGGVTYLMRRDYEFAYETILRFTSGAELPVTARLVGELAQLVVIRDAHGRPTRLSGYAQGRVEISDTQGHLLFQGRYYDSRVVQPLAGDEALTATGPRVADHWENGLGEARTRAMPFRWAGSLSGKRMRRACRGVGRSTKRTLQAKCVGHDSRTEHATATKRQEKHRGSSEVRSARYA